MNKYILVLLLIAIASCVKIEFDGSSLESWFHEIIEKMISKIIKMVDNPANQWFFIGNRLKQLIEVSLKYGKPKAVELCKSWAIEENNCSNLVDSIIRVLKDK